MRGIQIARQWKILRLLEARSQGVGLNELSVEFEVSLRTIYRDLNALQEAGYPLYNERNGKNAVWKLVESFRKHFPLPLTEAELMALCLSRDILGFFEGTIFYDGIETLFQKVKSSQLPANRTRLDKFSGTLRHQVVPNTEISKIQAIVKDIGGDNVKFKTVQIDGSVFNNDGVDFKEKFSENMCPRLTHIGGTL